MVLMTADRRAGTRAGMMDLLDLMTVDLMADWRVGMTAEMTVDLMAVSMAVTMAVTTAWTTAEMMVVTTAVSMADP